MADELETPEHDKLLAEPELEEQLERLFEWMATRGNKLKGGGTNRVALCELRPESITEHIMCPDCFGSGKNLKALSQRQQQVVKHMDLLRKEEKPWQQKEKAARERELKELEQWLGELAECENCYGRGKQAVYRQGDAIWQPAYHRPRELLAAMLDVDVRKLKEESAELFAQLRKQADERPTAADPEPEEKAA